MFGASSELDSVTEFGYYATECKYSSVRSPPTNKRAPSDVNYRSYLHECTQQIAMLSKANSL